MKIRNTLAIAMATMVISTNSIYAALVDENITTVKIANGVEQQIITQLYEGGIQKINLLKINPNDPGVEIDVLVSDKGFENRSTLSNLVKTEENVMAAVNGDFFSMSTPSFSIGPMVKDGEVISSPHYENNKYATFTIDENNKSVIEYLNHNESIKNLSKGNTTGVTAINKPSQNHAGIIVYTDEYRKNSIGASKTYFDMTEIVVENGIVTDVRVGEPSVPIPENGYVISAAASNSYVLQQNFSEGDMVKLETNYSLKYPNAETSFGGGTMLVKDFQPTALTQSTARAQRTAIGIGASGEILLMTVDGRTSPYIGMTEKEVQSFMMSQGAKEAMMLDGGGSTEMIVGDKIQNNVTSERSLLNGVAVKSTTNLGSLSKIEIAIQNDIIMQGEKVNFTVRGYDSNGNTVPVSSPKYVSEGVTGTFKNDTFTPTSSGSGAIAVTSGGVTDRVNINVLPSNGTDNKKVDNLTNFEIGILTDTSSSSNELVEQVIVGKLKQGINMGAFTLSFNSKDTNAINEITTQKETVTGAMQTRTYGDTLFATIDGSKAIGNTSSQWSYLKSALTGNYKNVIILSNSTMNLPDYEKDTWNQFLEDAAKTKNVYVVTKGNEYSGYKKGNVSYITTRDISTIDSQNKSDYKYLVFTNTNGQLTYGFKNIL